MDNFSLLSIFFTLAVAITSYWKWKSLYSGCCYCVKWLTIYIILKWRNLTDEFPGAGIPIFPSKREKYLENPRVWPAEKGWCRDSMLLWCGTPDLWLLAEVERGRHNSAAASVHLRLAQTEYLTSADVVEVAGGWSTESVSLECLEPMRRWRLACNARLNTRNQEGKKCTKHVRINLVWAALDGPYYFRSDADTFTLACVLAAHPFINRQLNLDSLGRGYEQWGAVVGWVRVGGDETPVHAPCLRRRCWGPLSPSPFPHRSLALIADDNTMVSVFSSSAIGRQLGHIRYPDGRIEKVSGSSILEFTESRERFVTTFSGCGGSHSVYAVRRQWSGGGNGCAEARCTLDGQPAIALMLYSNRKVRLARLPVVEFPVGVVSGGEEWLALPLDHPACACPSLVGGKAASLALLTDLAQTVLTNKMVVPVGFCLTVDAMRLQTQSSEAICAAVKFLGLVASGQEKGHLEKECQHAVQAWLSAPVCGAVQAALSAHLSTNANRRPLTTYAVRSSALTEDSPLASSAGLNASVLGCVNTQQVADALRKCWASLYAYRSVQYRRHAGLPVVTWMGVVVQEVVGGESAGVTFTRHPQSGDPHRLVITANYGLGETVVSGQVEPDTIVVNTERSSHHVVYEATVGKKQTRLTITGDGGVVSEPVPAKLCLTLCLSQPEVIALSRLGLALHRLFGSPCDIEWTIAKGVIYVVQCRPITCLFPWTDDELLHELDSAILPGDATTSANAGEVLPGVTSPLCQSTVLRCSDFMMVQKFAGVRHKSWYNNNHITLSHHHAFLHLYNTLLRGVGPEATLAQKVLELAVCGHRVTEEGEGRIQAAAAARHLATPPLTALQKGASALHVIKQILFSKSSAKKAQKIGEEFRIKCDGFTSASALYDYLTASYVHVLEVDIGIGVYV